MRRFRGQSGASHAAALALSVALLVLVLGSARADDLPVSAFFGEFRGSGIAVSTDSIYAPETARDMDVTIRSAGGGFSVSWTTVLRSDDGRVSRKSETLTFAPSGGHFRAADRADPFSAAGLAWARVKDQTLDVFLMMVDEAGRPTLQRYARSLTGRGMELRFTRTRDGRESRVVEGLLVKVAR